MNPIKWQISAGILAEGVRPVSFALVTIASTWVLADARRRRFSSAGAAAWTLLTLLFTPVTLPLYLIARSYTTRHERAAGAAAAAAPSSAPLPSTPNEAAAANGAQYSATAMAERAAPDGVADAAAGPVAARPRWRFALPLLYLMAVAAAGAVYFYLDYTSVDAHLMRASQARLDGRRERTIGEYRAALKSEDDPHTHKLLGIELAEAGRSAEALAEFRAAESGGEPDDMLPFHIATTLEALGRPLEAAAEYEKFLHTRLCAAEAADRPLSPDTRCTQAQALLRADAVATPR